MTKRKMKMVMSGTPRTGPTLGEIASWTRATGWDLNGMPLPNPDIVLKRMGKDITVYKDLLVDAHIGGCVSSRKSGVLSLSVDLNRGKAKTPATELVQGVFDKLDMRGVISSILDAPLFGYAVSEIIWQFNGSMWLPQRIDSKPQEWFCFGEQADLRFKSAAEPINGEPLPGRKFLCAQSGANRENPYGFAELSKVFWPGVFKKGGLKFWVTFAEKYGSPHIVAKLPRGKVTEESSELLGLLEQMVQDAIAVIPDDASVEVKDYASGASSDVYERLLNYLRSEISIGLLGQTLSTDVGERGSNAAAQSHLTVRKDIVDSDKAIVEQTLNQLAQWIVEVNLPGAEAPTVGLYAPEDIDLPLAQRDETLTRQGVRFRKSYYQREYGLQDGDFDLVDPTSASAAAIGAFAGKDNMPPAVNAPEKPAPERRVPGNSSPLTAEELQAQADGLLKPIIELVKTSTTHEELLEKLAESWPGMDIDALEEMLARAIFVTEALQLLKKEDSHA